MFHTYNILYSINGFRIQQMIQLKKHWVEV